MTSNRDRQALRDFRDGRSAARQDKPRSVCNIRPSSKERWDAWQAGYDYEIGRGDLDGVTFTVARGGPSSGGLTDEEYRATYGRERPESP